MAMMNSIMDMNSFRQPWNTQPIAPVHMNFVTPPLAPGPSAPAPQQTPEQGQGGIPDMLMKQAAPQAAPAPAPGAVPATAAAPQDGGMLGSIMKMFGGGGGAGGAAGGAAAAGGPATAAGGGMDFAQLLAMFA